MSDSNTPDRDQVAVAFAIRVLSTQAPASYDVTTAIALLERTLPPSGGAASRAVWDAVPATTSTLMEELSAYSETKVTVEKTLAAARERAISVVKAWGDGIVPEALIAETFQCDQRDVELAIYGALRSDPKEES